MFLEGLYREDLPMKYICCSIQGLNTQYTLRRIQSTQTNIHLTHMFQSSYLSRISQIIFMEKKLSWGELLGNLGKFWRNFGTYWEILRKFGKFCHSLRAFMWRKIEPKGSFVEKNDKYEVYIF